jgi:replicative DNA helicase
MTNQQRNELERSILVGIIYGHIEAIGKYDASITVKDFSSLEHKVIFRMFQQIKDWSSEEIDINTIIDFDEELFGEILSEYYPDPHEMENGKKRIQSILESFKDSLPPENTEANVKMLKNYSKHNIDFDEYPPIGSASTLDDAIQKAIDRTKREKDGEIFRYKSGFERLDEAIKGFENGRLYILGAEPKLGKSLLISQWAYNIAQENIPVAIISLEMTTMEIAQRYLCTKTDTNTVNELNVIEMEKIKGELESLPIMLYDEPLHIEQLTKLVDTLVTENGIKIIFIDYLGLIGGSFNSRTKTDEFNDIVRTVKNLAKQFDIPIIAVASLAIKQMYAYKRNNKKPTAGDFRDSGQLSYDADCIIFLWRPNEADETRRELCVAFSRHTKQGVSISLFFDTNKLLFSESSSDGHIEEERPPSPPVKDYFASLRRK